MSNERTTLALSLGFGAMSGMRSISGLAFISRHLSEHGRNDSLHPAVSVLAMPMTSKVLTALAAGEMTADKLPIMPDRTEPAALMGRAVLGALSGFAVAEYRGGNRLAGTLLGTLSAVGSTFLFYRIRKEMESRTAIPDGIAAIVEDALVLAGGSSLVARMDS